MLVVSAMGKETDELLRLAGAVSSTHPGREMDMLITAGERKAIALVCMALHDLGIHADSFTGSQAGLLTDTNHRNAKILDVTPERVRAALDAGRVAVVAGAQGVSTDRNVTFLGRGAATPPPSRSPKPSEPTRARSTPTCRGCSRPTRGWSPAPARCTASPSTRCWR